MDFETHNAGGPFAFPTCSPAQWTPAPPTPQTDCLRADHSQGCPELLGVLQQTQCLQEAGGTLCTPAGFVTLSPAESGTDPK